MTLDSCPSSFSRANFHLRSAAPDHRLKPLSTFRSQSTGRGRRIGHDLRNPQRFCPHSLSLSRSLRKDELCSAHIDLHTFLKTVSTRPIFVGLSSVGSMGFLKNPQAFLHVLRTVIEITSYRFILFIAGFEALDAAVHMIAAEASSCSSQTQLSEDCISLFNSQLFCFTGYVSSNIRKLAGRR
ncbi:uncharacterized protein LOC142642632 isoform X2 [Castanea sativa]|uniref:uncharacterized protein LOC142642632 isoform X2 n=1 Tax=Castanea sativa TaxID=21020 RepID=UPI003F653730